jgi:hypothetical protein
MKRILFLLLFASQSLFAQNVLETNPTGLKWLQINSPHFRVIFPEGFDFQAQRIASTLERIRSAESKSMGREPRKISVILQNQSAVSNGFVSMFPRRSEFYAMPSQNYNFAGTNDWLDLLASHEYRHIVQYQHATRGFNKLLLYLFGAPTFAGMAHAAAPDWFWEGDAVATETAFTPSGRGKIPNFNLLFRTNLVEGRSFNYHKQYLRSYKNNIPNHYVLGFNMVSYLRKRTNDPDVWEKITKRSWNVPFIPFAFSNAIRKETGMSVTRLYREMSKDLSKQWKSEIEQLELSEFETINRRQGKAYTDYSYPQPQADGSVIVMKHGIGDIDQFVRIKDGVEKVEFTPGYSNDAGSLSTGAGIIVWNEFGYDPRWQVRNYSLVKSFDTEKNKRKVISDKDSRFASASISPDGKHVVTIRTDVSYKHALVVLNYPSGEIEFELANPQNHFYSMPRWSAAGDKIAVLKLTGNGKTVSIIDVASKTSEDIFPESHENIGHPMLVDHLLYFSSPVSGIDNIYVFDLRSKTRYQVTESKYGAYNPVVDPGARYLYYNEQTRDGLDVVRVPFDGSKLRDFVPEKKVSNLYDHLVEQEGEPGLFQDIPQGNHPVQKFSKLRHAINPFSWGLLFENDLSRIDIGISSQDILSTTSITAGYTYDLAEETGLWRAGLSYQGFYPIIDVNFSDGKRSVEEEITTTIINDDVAQFVTDTYEFSWREQNVDAGLRIPLNLTSSKYASGLEGGYAVGLTKITDFDNGLNGSRFFPAVIRDNNVEREYFFIDYLNDGSIIYNHASFLVYRLLKQSRRDLASKWGQVLSIDYFDTPFGGDFQGGLFAARGNLYFPGLFKHHALFGHAAYQKTILPVDLRENNYLFRNAVPLPRGINDYVSRHRDFFSASINYAFPLWYPDIALGPILNIQRVRINLFGDYASGESTIISLRNNQYISIGGELKFDLNIMRFLPQFDLGVRYSYGIDPSVTNFELVIGTFNF